MYEKKQTLCVNVDETQGEVSVDQAHRGYDIVVDGQGKTL